MHQLEIEVVYNLRCESAASMYDLRQAVTYLCQRIGTFHGRIWFGAGMAINAKLTASQRRNFLRFLNRHGLRRYLVLDDFHKKQPARPASSARAPMDVLGRVEGPDAESSISAPGSA